MKKELEDMGPEGIDVETKGPLAMVTLRRPHRLNAFNPSMFAALEDAARELSTAPVPRAVIVTGAGPDAFSSGFDVNPDNPMVTEMARAMEHGETEPISRSVGALHAAVDRFVALPVPIIAAINGKAFGGGAELAVRCDLRVMDPAAVVCFSEVRLGLMPDWGGGGHPDPPDRIGGGRGPDPDCPPGRRCRSAPDGPGEPHQPAGESR